ncbi:MAG: XrtA/PEP-CTERM system TPR-repeat protein PrsT, partial [Candidatus Binatia bacterium]
TAAEQDLLKVINAQPKHPQALLMLADTYYRQNKLNQAESHLKSFNGYFPGQLAAHKLLGAVYLRERKTDEAIETLLPFAEIEPPDPGLLSLLSYSYYSQGDTVNGKSFLEKAQAITPNSPILQAQAALGEIASGNSAVGIANLEKLALAAPDNPRPRQLLAAAHLLEGDEVAAIDTAKELVEINPKDPQAHNLLGTAYAQSGDKQRARTAFNVAAALDPKFAPALANLGFLALAEQNSDEGKKKLQAALRADDTYTPAALALANLAERAGDDGEARRLLEQASTANPREPAPRWRLADRLLASGRRDEAIKLADETFQLASSSAPNRLRFGAFQLRAQQFSAAYETLSALQAKIDQPSLATFLLAEAARATQRFDEARKHYQAVDAAHPGALDVLWGLFATEIGAKAYDAAAGVVDRIKAVDAAAGEAARGELAAARGDFPLAVQALRAALDLKPDTAAFGRYVKGLRRMGDIAAVRSAYVEWFGQYPKDVASRIDLGAFELEQRDFAAARTAFENVLKIAPDNPIALNNLAWLYDVAGDERALATAEKAYQLLPNTPEAADTLGWILVRQEQLHRGTQLLEQARAARPQEPNIGYHYAYALAAAGAKARAQEIVDELLANEQPFDSLNDARALQRRLVQQ